MTGALSVAIGDTITTLTSQSYGAILNTYKASNWEARRTLLINTVETHPDLTNALQLGYFENGAWKEQSILHTGNKSLIKPADIGAPTLTGEGASGSWPISITGQADSVYGRYTRDGGSQPPSYIGRNTVKFNMMRTFIDNKLDPGGYMDCMLMNTYSWSDVPYATAFGMLKTIDTPRAFIACGGNSNTTWSNATELLSVANYNEHVPSKTGVGASGTWPISISGNAASLSSILQISKGGTSHGQICC